jgi:hypothetical protein
MESRTIQIPNGDRMVNFTYYYCEICGKELPECNPHYIDDDKYYCGECAYLADMMTDKEYAKSFVFSISGARTAKRDGEIFMVRGNEKFPWERSKKQERNTREYAAWRRKVFERDDFTCQECGQRGGTLNAHHIKSFSKFKNLRYVLSNGLTLCEQCHKRKHRKEV